MFSQSSLNPRSYFYWNVRIYIYIYALVSIYVISRSLLLRVEELFFIVESRASRSVFRFTKFLAIAPFSSYFIRSASTTLFPSHAGIRARSKTGPYRVYGFLTDFPNATSCRLARARASWGPTVSACTPDQAPRTEVYMDTRCIERDTSKTRR